MRRNLIRAALIAGLFLSAGVAPVLANALDSQLQPIAAPIPRETVPFDGRESPGTIIIRTGERQLYLVMPDTALASDGQVLRGPALPISGTSESGRIGRRRPRC
jgi:lipoprotein-anchoring transpeptidase ErfK/SrfK